MTSKKDLDKIIDKKEEQTYIKLVSELEPYFKGIKALDIKSKEFQLFKKNYKYFFNKFTEKLKIFANLFIFKDDVSISDIKGQLTQLFAYLGTVESVGNAIVDFLVMLLVSNGIDFHIECKYGTPKIMHATSIKQLEKERVSLGTKLNFLRENNIKTIPSIIDNTLRNRIAHLDFRIKENHVFIKDKDAFPQVHIAQRKLSFLIGAMIVLLVNLGNELGLITTIVPRDWFGIKN